MVAVLFLDMEGTFLNTVSHHLLHNLHVQQLPEEYVHFIDQLLMGRWTKLKFDGFMSEWLNIDNGSIQGDPLSMILYLFYNADLLMDVKKQEMKIAYVNDVNFYAEGADFKEAYE